MTTGKGAWKKRQKYGSSRADVKDIIKCRGCERPLWSGYSRSAGVCTKCGQKEREEKRRRGMLQCESNS